MMRTVFDPATAFLVAGIFYITLPVAAWVVMRNWRSRAVDVWFLGSLLQGCGTLFLALRLDWPGWLAFGVTNFFLYSGNLVHVVALRMELGVRPRWGLSMALLVFFLGVQEFFRLELQSGALRFSWALLVLGGLMSQTAILGWQLAKSEGGQSARWLSGAFAFGAMVVLSWSVFVVLGLSEANPLGVNWHSALASLAMFGIAVFGTVAILGLYLDRARRRDLNAALEEEKSRASLQLAHQLAIANRRGSMGELAAAMAHELAQPLTAVAVEAGLLKRELGGERSPVAVLAENITRQVDRASHILHGIRKFIQPSDPEFKPVNLLVVVHEVMQLLPTVGAGARAPVSIRSAQTEAWVSGDFVQLSQVVLNLLRNAMQAQRPGQPVQIVLALARQDASMVLSIEDNGVGFSEQGLAVAGQPFSTSTSAGMGIGLAISRRIAEWHGGTLTLGNRADGQGAQVRLVLPALDAGSSH